LLFRFFATVVLCLTLVSSASAAPPDLSRLRVDTTKVDNARALILTCDLIVSGNAGRQVQSVPTRVTLRQGKVVNYVQTFHVQRTWKGTSAPVIKVLRTGIEPLPDARDPLNLIYPGPLSEGEFLLFLKKVQGTDLYQVVGVWQGVYPVQSGRTIALQGSGFPQLNGLTLDQVADQIKSLQSFAR